MRSARKRKLPSLFAALLALFCLAGCVDYNPPLQPHEGTWYFAKNAAECRIGEGKIYQDNLHAKEGQTLIGVYTETEDHIEAHLSGVGGVEVLRRLYVVQTGAGEVLCDSADGSGTVYFYRDPLSAMAALEAAEETPDADVFETVPEPAPDNSSPSDEPGTKTMPSLEEEPSSQPEPVAKSGNMVWVSQTGSKYHSNPTCSGMKNPTQITKAQAESRGLSPCKRCY